MRKNGFGFFFMKFFIPSRPFFWRIQHIHRTYICEEYKKVVINLKCIINFIYLYINNLWYVDVNTNNSNVNTNNSCETSSALIDFLSAKKPKKLNNMQLNEIDLHLGCILEVYQLPYYYCTTIDL